MTEQIKTDLGSSELNLLDVIAIFWKARKTVLYITLVFIIIGLIYALLATKWYQATVKIMPTSSERGGTMSQYANIAALAGINIKGDKDDRFSLYPEIIKSNFILERILKNRFKTQKYTYPVTLFEFWDIDVDSNNVIKKHILIEEAKQTLREKYINAIIDKKVNLLTMTINVPTDPILAAELANFIADQLDIYNKYFRNYKARDQREFVGKSIKDTKSELESSESALIIFKEENRDLSSPEKMLQYERLKTEVEVQRTVYIELRKQFEIAKIEEIKETETLDILERAVVPIKKIKPQRLIILISFTFIGIIFSILFIVVNFIWVNLAKSLKKFKK